MTKPRFDLSALAYSEFKDDKQARKARGELVGNIAEKLGVSRRQVNRIIDGSRRANTPLPSESVAKIRREIRKSGDLFTEAVEGRATAKDDPRRYLINRERAGSFSEAKELAEELKNEIENPEAGDSPSILDRAKQIEIRFIPPGGKYSEETRSGAKKTNTAGESGVFLVDVIGTVGETARRR